MRTLSHVCSIKNFTYKYFFFLLNFRANNNWQTNFASISKSNENSPQVNKKKSECTDTGRDSVAYSCLLKNELLGTAIEDIKTITDDRPGEQNYSTHTPNRGLFKFQSPKKQVSFFISFKHN